MKDGILVEHWDVIQDEATRESSKSGLPMFSEKFGGERKKINFSQVFGDRTPCSGK